MLSRNTSSEAQPSFAESCVPARPPAWGTETSSQEGLEQFLDFLPDLDPANPASDRSHWEPSLGCEGQYDASHTQQINLSSVERNRLTQKRYRQRQKVCQPLTTAQLACSTVLCYMLVGKLLNV